MTVGAALVIVGLALGLPAVFMIGISRSVTKNSPIDVLRHLRAPAQGYTVEVRGTRGAWNPAGTSGNRRLIGQGTATYQLQQTKEGGIVHLTFVSSDGSTQNLSGPVTERLRQAAEQKGLRAWRYFGPLIGLTQLAMGAIGVAIALGVTSGHSNSARVAGVFIGAGVGGFVVPQFGMLTVLVGVAIMKTIRGQAT